MLSTREIASIIWIVLFFLYFLFHLRSNEKEEIKIDLKNVIKCLFVRKLLILFISIFICTFVVTIIFSKNKFWDIIFVKDIMIWMFFYEMKFIFDKVSEKKYISFTKQFIKSNFSIIVIVEYLISSFTFSLWIELLLFPWLLILTTMMIYSSDEINTYKKIISFLYGSSIILIIVFSFARFITNIETINIEKNLISFMIPIIYSAIFIPINYFWKLYSLYDELFIREPFKDYENKKMIKEYCIPVIKKCGFSIKKVYNARRIYASAINEPAIDRFYKIIGSKSK